MRKFVLAALAVLSLAAAVRADEAHPPCDVSASAKRSFSSPSASDIITATVRGSPCWSGRFRITIRASDGALLYEYDEPFKQHTAVHWADDQALLEAATELVEKTVGNALSQTSADLPAFLPPDELGEEYNTRVLVPAGQYQGIRSKAAPALVHLTHYEAWRWVVFDPEAKRALVVAEGGF